LSIVNRRPNALSSADQSAATPQPLGSEVWITGDPHLAHALSVDWLSADEPDRCPNDVRSISRVRTSKGDGSDDDRSSHRYADDDEGIPRERMRLDRCLLHYGLLRFMAELKTLSRLWPNN
jgi:hypothetical protein